MKVRTMQGSEAEGTAPGAGGRATARASLRALQERSIRARQRVDEMEFALAREAASVAAVLALRGLAFDPLTFVAVRILDAGLDVADPIQALDWLLEDGAVERSVALAAERLRGLEASE
jgi:hypothetical protein